MSEGYDRVRPEVLTALAKGSKPVGSEAQRCALELQEHRSGKFAPHADVIGWIAVSVAAKAWPIQGDHFQVTYNCLVTGPDRPTKPPGDDREWLPVCAQ